MANVNFIESTAATKLSCFAKNSFDSPASPTLSKIMYAIIKTAKIPKTIFFIYYFFIPA